MQEAYLSAIGGLLPGRGASTIPVQQPWQISRALGRIVVSPYGALDAEFAEHLQAILSDLIEGQGNLEVVIDAMQVASIDDPAIEVLVEASRRMGERHGTLVISSARPEVVERLERHALVLSPPRQKSPDPSSTGDVIDLRERLGPDSQAGEVSADRADAVIQRLLEVCLVLQLATALAGDGLAERLAMVVNDLDEIIHEVQRTAFEQVVSRSGAQLASAASTPVAERIRAVEVAVEQLRTDIDGDPTVTPEMRARLAEAAGALAR